jgi:SPP1 gp7 family putative phage head morphogenesis protein
MKILNNLKTTINNKITDSVPENVILYANKATEYAEKLSEKAAEKRLRDAREKYILPNSIEKKLINGMSSDKCIAELKKDTAFSNLERKELKELVLTAQTRIMAERSIKEMEDDYEYYKISTCGDACKLCKSLSNKRFKIKNRKIGVNFPPFHLGCRCTFTVDVKDWDKWMKGYEKKHK